MPRAPSGIAALTAAALITALCGRAAAQDLLAQDTLTGDWGGWRPRLEELGLQFGAASIDDGLGNPLGGVRQGAIYEGRLELFLNVDFERVLGWSGATLHANAYQIHGRGLSGNDIGNLLLVSNIEADRSTRLFDLWLEQEFFDRKVSVRAGRLGADDEFVTSQYAASFVNSTFGWPGILAVNLPSGGPAYPLATPGIRVRGAPTAELSLSAAVFNGDPGGPGTGDPQRRNASGTSFRLSGDALVIAEAAYAINQDPDASGRPRTIKLGAWYHAGRFADQHLDTSGLSLANPASSGVPAMHRGDHGVYLVLDQQVSGGTPGSGLGGFVRIAANRSDRNLVSLYADAGATDKGLLPGRGDDVVGLAAGYARISSAARSLDRDTQTFTGRAVPVRDGELILEVTYQWQMAHWWVIQPDVQYILHPGGHIADPGFRAGTRAIADALVLGLRSAITF
jgi:porin